MNPSLAESTKTIIDDLASVTAAHAAATSAALISLNDRPLAATLSNQAGQVVLASSGGLQLGQHPNPNLWTSSNSLPLVFPMSLAGAVQTPVAAVQRQMICTNPPTPTASAAAVDPLAVPPTHQLQHNNSKRKRRPGDTSDDLTHSTSERARLQNMTHQEVEWIILQRHQFGLDPGNKEDGYWKVIGQKFEEQWGYCRLIPSLKARYSRELSIYRNYKTVLEAVKRKKNVVVPKPPLFFNVFEKSLKGVVPPSVTHNGEGKKQKQGDVVDRGVSKKKGKLGSSDPSDPSDKLAQTFHALIQQQQQQQEQFLQRLQETIEQGQEALQMSMKITVQDSVQRAMQDLAMKVAESSDLASQRQVWQ